MTSQRLLQLPRFAFMIFGEIALTQWVAQGNAAPLPSEKGRMFARLVRLNVQRPGQRYVRPFAEIRVQFGAKGVQA